MSYTSYNKLEEVTKEFDIELREGHFLNVEKF